MTSLGQKRLRQSGEAHGRLSITGRTHAARSAPARNAAAADPSATPYLPEGRTIHGQVRTVLHVVPRCLHRSVAHLT